MKKTRLLVIPVVIALVAFSAYQGIFTLPKQSHISSISAQGVQVSLQCYQNEHTVALDRQGQLNLLVWNIYKQNNPTWQQSLTQLSQEKQLVLLQEASMTSDLVGWIERNQWFGSQVDAFKAFETTAGVLNLSYAPPSRACAYTELEPWLRLPKSALYATYPLSNGEELAVVNIHAVNFTYGTIEYRRQIEVLASELEQHQGPIIVAGDFNSWSRERLSVMAQALSGLALQEVSYSPDHRTQFVTGLPLDHVLFRGLTLEAAETPISDASDHNPIVVHFRLNKPIKQ